MEPEVHSPEHHRAKTLLIASLALFIVIAAIWYSQVQNAEEVPPKTLSVDEKAPILEELTKTPLSEKEKDKIIGSLENGNREL
jgi:hypothetical protein